MTDLERPSSWPDDVSREVGWHGCPLVNPLCPDDLCVRDPNHKGHHMLGTDPEPMPLANRKVMFMYDGDEEVTEELLIRLGAERQRELFPR